MLGKGKNNPEAKASDDKAEEVSSYVSERAGRDARPRARVRSRP